MAEAAATTNYHAFLAGKAITAASSGVDVAAGDLPAELRPFQRDLVRWALRKGRAALFCDTGLGKTFMQLAWASFAAPRALVVAPLAVAGQTVREGARWGIPVTYARDESGAAPTGITVTNYEMAGRFDPAGFGAVVLDESSILKSHDGKTRGRLIHDFRGVPMRLCCTATPAPNDVAELANHAEFLGVMTRPEMLASFFVHDDAGWRLKGHARDPFHRWLASWAMTVKRPSDLGYDDAGYALPPLRVEPVIVPVDWAPADRLFFTGLKGVADRAAVRRATLPGRVAAAAALVQAEPGEPWVAWCGLNDEQDALAAAVGAAGVSIAGSLSADEKIARLDRWLAGEARVLVTKPSVFGFGMNFQRCARIVFVGLSDSYEQYYQAIRRCWRFGQDRPVVAHVVLSAPEEPIYHNVLRKEAEAEATGRELVRHLAGFELAEIGHARQLDAYDPRQTMRLPTWLARAEVAA